MIDETEMLVHLGKASRAERAPEPVDYSHDRFRRPRLFERGPDPHDSASLPAPGAPRSE